MTKGLRRMPARGNATRQIAPPNARIHRKLAIIPASPPVSPGKTRMTQLLRQLKRRLIPFPRGRDAKCPLNLGVQATGSTVCRLARRLTTRPRHEQATKTLRLDRSLDDFAGRRRLELNAPVAA